MEPPAGSRAGFAGHESRQNPGFNPEKGHEKWLRQELQRPQSDPQITDHRPKIADHKLQCQIA
jgi:hypothetical protein